jgi:hypothetical protein
MAGLPRDTTRDQVLAALTRFDTELRPLPKWAGWDTKTTQKYVLEHDGKTYPPKQIVALASGCPVNTFSGGDETNRWLAKRDITVRDLRDGP